MSRCDRGVEKLSAILNSPEIQSWIRSIESRRWTGRPGFPVSAMVGCCISKPLYERSTWTRAVRLVAEHHGMQEALRGAPSHWACYRFAEQLRDQDRPALVTCTHDVLQSLHSLNPRMGHTVAVDSTALPAYATASGKDRSGRRRDATDPDAAKGWRSATSHQPASYFFGYKCHAVVCVTTGLVLASTVQPANASEKDFALPLLQVARALGFPIAVAVMDKGYDYDAVHEGCMNLGIDPVISLRETARVRRGAAEPPHCQHGEWLFAGAERGRRTTKWRCPTRACSPASVRVKADRLHPLIPRDSDRWRALYRQRTEIEREFARLKTDWGLLPLLTRGLAQVQLHIDLTLLARLACALAN